MRRTLALLIVSIGLLALPDTASAYTAEEQLAFAEHLASNGDDGSALLEYRRYLFHHPSHHGAAQAKLMVSRLLISHGGDIAAARRQLDALQQEHSGSQDAQRAQQFAQFIDVNSDFDGRPLVLYFKARSAATRGSYSEAADGYQQLLDQYPRARLADETRFKYGRMLVEHMNQPQRGRQMLSDYVSRNPDSSKAGEANYYMALAAEQQGESNDARQTYQQIVNQHPGTDAARLAQTRLDEMARQQNTIERQYSQAMAVQYDVLRQGYLGRNDRYDVITRVAPGTNPQQIQATLEQAVIDHQSSRNDPNHTIRIEAYFNYPLTKAGAATWQPGQQVQVDVEKRETEDVVTDAIFELLK